MPRSRNTTPRYLQHSSGRARAIWHDPIGGRRERLLPGPYDSPESKAAYGKLILEIASQCHPPSPAAPRPPRIANGKSLP